jgi:4-amino-4-deoxy-L-arabinose transferase-like glycosyltransferase
MDAAPPTKSAPPSPAYGTTLSREWPLACLVLLVFAIYFTRIDALTIRGEESRRATVAMEMLETGDWIVPRQQGESKFMSSRPPVHNWLIALAALARGQLDTFAVRLPSVIAVLLTTLFLYAYARTVLSPLGATAVAAAYATFGQVQELGRLGETDAVFTLFLSSAMLTFHWGHTQGWPAWKTWMGAYALAALATLTKGPQAPVYFAASVGVYLLAMRQWRYAFSWAHLAGIALYALIFGAWFVPFASSVGIEGVRHTFTGDVSIYLNDWSPRSVIWQYTMFPLSIVLGSLLPWSLLLFAWADSRFRQRLGPAAPYALFATGAILICLPSVWLIPGTRSRFVVSLYPCFAVLVGIVVERCAAVQAPPALRVLWERFLRFVSVGMVLAAVALVIVKAAGPASVAGSQSMAFVAVAALAAGALAAVCWQARAAADEQRQLRSVLAVAAFAGLAFSGVFANWLMSKSQRMDLAVQQFQEDFPREAKIVSLKPVFHLFPYYHGRIIPIVTDAADPKLAEAEYFCFDGRASKGPPFALNRPYQVVAEFCCDREVGKNVIMVTVGRFVPETAATDAGRPQRY